MEVSKVVIDAKNGILGRIASFAAKQALLGKAVIVVNCNEAIVSGAPKTTFVKYRQARERGGTAQRGPNISRVPEKLMKRTIRGMLSYKQGRGREALDRVKCYNEVPAEYSNLEMVSIIKPIKAKTVTLINVCREM